MNSFLSGRRIVTLFASIAGLGLWIFSAAGNAINYTEVIATVDRVEEVCRSVGHPLERATSAQCAQAQADAPGKWWRHQAVHLHYQSPADGRAHPGLLIPTGGQSAVDVLKLHPGDPWRILAHHRKPMVIKAE